MKISWVWYSDQVARMQPDFVFITHQTHSYTYVQTQLSNNSINDFVYLMCMKSVRIKIFCSNCRWLLGHNIQVNTIVIVYRGNHIFCMCYIHDDAIWQQATTEAHIAFLCVSSNCLFLINSDSLCVYLCWLCHKFTRKYTFFS